MVPAPLCGRLPQSFHVDFFHFQQRLHRAFGFLRRRTLYYFFPCGRHNLPGYAIFVFEPAALHLFSAREEPGPQLVNFRLGFAIACDTSQSAYLVLAAERRCLLCSITAGTLPPADLEGPFFTPGRPYIKMIR